MGVPNPSARGDTGLNGRLGKTEKDLAQLRRLIEAREKPAKVDAAPAPTGTVALAIAYSNTVTTTGSGYPSFSDWTFEQDDVGMTPDDAYTFLAPVGIYVAKVKLGINVSPVTEDLWLSANINSTSAYVTHELPIYIGSSTGSHPGSHTIGPLPVTSVIEGRFGVAFAFHESPGIPSVDGTCSYIIAKIG